MDIRTLPTHPGTGLAAIGYRADGRPIWPIAGAAEDTSTEGDADPDGGDEDDDPESDADEPEGEGEPDWTPPSRDDWEKLQAKLKRANDQAKRLREAAKGPAKATPAKAAPAKKAAPAPAADADTDDTATADNNAELERWQVRALRADAKAELLGRGCNPKMVKLALAELNGADIDWDGDSPILDDWLDQMEDEYPELFAKQAPVKSAPRKAGSIDQGAAATGSATQPQRPFGEALLRRGGWGTERRHGVAGRRN